MQSWGLTQGATTVGKFWTSRCSKNAFVESHVLRSSWCSCFVDKLGQLVPTFYLSIIDRNIKRLEYYDSFLLETIEIIETLETGTKYVQS